VLATSRGATAEGREIGTLAWNVSLRDEFCRCWFGMGLATCALPKSTHLPSCTRSGPKGTSQAAAVGLIIMLFLNFCCNEPVHLHRDLRLLVQDICEITNVAKLL